MAAEAAFGISPLRSLVTFGPVWLLFGALDIAIEALDRKKVRWTLAFVAWSKEASRSQLALLRAAYGIGIGIAGALATIPASKFHLAFPGMFGNPLGWLLYGGWMAVCMSLFGKPYEPPEDWLLWDLKSKANN